LWHDFLLLESANLEVSMTTTSDELRPPHLWKHFDGILKIPHGSGNEKALGDHVLAFARSLKLAGGRDKTGNIIVRKPASTGRESSPVTVLQGHLDMVNEKNSDVAHDFSKDPIMAVVKDGWMRAQGTTLGADNGIGLAASLAVMEDASLVHGPLEFLFTIEEETGLIGARTIEPGSLKAKYLLNLDSEDEGTYTIGCSGGGDSEIAFPLKRTTSSTKTAFRLKLSGLRGGHSGLDITQGRANALKLLARVLVQAAARLPIQLIRIEGGNKRNAIPREAWADFLLDPAKIPAFQALLDKAGADIRVEFGTVEKEFQGRLEEIPRKAADAPLTAASQAALIDFLNACPHGVQRMHPEIAGLAESSTNLALIRCAKAKAEIICSSRSPIGPALEAVRASLKSLAVLSGAKIRQPEAYPGWAPNLRSPLLQKMKDVYRKTFDHDVRVVAVHAGLECGIIGEKFPGMDMISLGPTIAHPHSPEEGVEVASVAAFWTLLTAALKELS
jgi:dipeptidase D